jgi:sulfoacetaldehyde dehydrogenase
MSKPLSENEKMMAGELIKKAQVAMKAIENFDQKKIDRLCQAIGWALANEKTFTRIAYMGIEESGIGDYETRLNKRFKIQGVLRDCLRQKSIGIIEEIPEKGIVKYGKPAGVVVSLVPTTNPEMTPGTTAIPALKCRDAVIFCPHPRSKRTTFEAVSVLRKALQKQGVTPDVFQCVENPSNALTNELMSICDLVMATGGAAMVKAAYSSGTPAYGVGAGNATMIVDETANVDEAARFAKMSKMMDNGSGCSADGNLLVEASLYDNFVKALQKEGGYLASDKEKSKLISVMWDSDGHRTSDTIACPAAKIASKAGFALPENKKFIIVEQSGIGKDQPFSSEKLSPTLAVYKYTGFQNALEMVDKLLHVGGRGHSCTIYSFDDDHINQLASKAPVSRIMVRQPTSLSNSGSFTNGMPMTASLGCGTWGRNVVSENISLKHFMNTTWVSRPIAEDRPREEELFGEFYKSEVF